MPTICAVYLIFTLWMTIQEQKKIIFTGHMRIAISRSGHVLGNVICPGGHSALVWVMVICWTQKGDFGTSGRDARFVGSLRCFWRPVYRVCSAEYSLNLGIGTINQYLLFMAVDLLFLICGIIYLAKRYFAGMEAALTKTSLWGTNLFFWEMTSKLSTTSKIMTMICITLTAAILMLLAVPVLTGWSEGYLAIRSMYDVQISSRYNNV